MQAGVQASVQTDMQADNGKDKRTRASSSQKPSSSRPCIFLQCRCVGTKQTLPQAFSDHNKTILPSSYLTPFDTTHTIPPQISTLASPATTSFTPHNHISPHTHTRREKQRVVHNVHALATNKHFAVILQYVKPLHQHLDKKPIKSR